MSIKEDRNTLNPNKSKVIEFDNQGAKGDLEVDLELSPEDFDKLNGMEDDEAVIELDKMTVPNDSVLKRDYLSSLVEQDDKVVYYEVENIYRGKNSRMYKNKLKLRREPPTLVIKDDHDNEATFFLTENLTDELIDTLNQVKRAYYGFSGPEEFDKPDRIVDRFKVGIKSQPLKILLPVIIVVFIMFFSLKN